MRRHPYLPLALLLLGLTVSSPAAIQVWEEDQVEREIKEALAADRTDRDAIERMIELCESRGDFQEAANWVLLLTKAGTAQSLVEGKLADLRTKIADDQDIPIWESRLEVFQSKEEWRKALKEVGKLIEKYSSKVGRLKSVKLDYHEKKQAAQEAGNPDGVMDPNVDGMLENCKIRRQELIGLEAELKEKAKSELK